MSVENVEKLLREMKKDVAIAAMIGADPRRLDDYDLEPAEKAALLNQDPDALREMGVDDELAEGAKMVGRMTG